MPSLRSPSPSPSLRPSSPSVRRQAGVAAGALAAGLALAISLLAPSARADEYDARAEAGGWKFTFGGFVHGAYRWVKPPATYTLVGRNNGFQLAQGRVGANAEFRDTLAVRVSVEGASEDRINQSFPGGQLTVRLRDAYITWAPLRALRVSLGQMITPWDLDSMRSGGLLPFVSRAVPVEGVQPNEGYATRGLGQDRNIGLSVHSGDIPLAGALTARYAILVGNGNGENRLLNDNNKPALFGRVELAYWGARERPSDRISPMIAVTDRPQRPLVNLGGAFQYNPRTVGNPPDLIEQADTGGSVDVALSLVGVDLQAGFLYVRTRYQTLAATPDLERFGVWAHLRYTIPRLPVELTPGYRVATYAPRGHLRVPAPGPLAAQLDGDLGLVYHTLGVTVRPTRTFPVRLNFNYTITSERGPNVLDNDRVELDAIAIF